MWAPLISIVFAAAATGAASTVSAAENFPQRPVKLIVGFAPGGPTDVLARILATGMSRHLGQQVVVENRAGAGGIIGTQAVVKADADGHTLLFAGDGTLTVLPQLAPSRPYDVDKELTPLRLVTSQVNVLVAHASKGLRNVPSLLAAARANPGGLTFGSAGTGAPSYLVGALFQTEAGIELTHVPYKGAGPAMTDLIGGQIDMMFVGMPVALQNASRKELVLLAVTGNGRAAALPDVPTFGEAGVKGLGAETAVWWAVMAPAGIPATARDALVKSMQAALADPETLKAFAHQGVEVLNRDADVVSSWIARDRERWARLIREKRIATDR